MGKLEFRSLKIMASYGKTINKIYYVVENGRSTVEAFFKLSEEERINIRQIIVRMATEEHFISPMVKYTLNKYAFGEIRPRGQRFFFFRKVGNNYVFFGHCEKKRKSLPDQVYKQLEKRMKIYEKEFTRINRGF